MGAMVKSLPELQFDSPNLEPSWVRDWRGGGLGGLELELP